MKKVLLSIMAVAALASCVQNEELVGVSSNNAIAFDNAYVGNATKAIDGSFDNSNLGLFQVYGTVDNTSGITNIFDGVAVEKNTTTNAWTYAEEYTQYWVAGNNYCFKAVVAGNEANETAVNIDAALHMPTSIDLLDASAQNDILYAEVLDVNYAGNVQPVKFTFKHLLAKAKVTVKETAKIENGGYYVVENVYLKGTHKQARYTIGAGWANYNDAYNLQFGDIVNANEENEGAAAIQLPLGTGATGASNYERLIVPQNDCALTIVVDYTYYNNGLAQQTVTGKEINTTANIEAGKAYNFVLALAEPGEPITFDVEDVTDWVEGGIKTAADLKTALANGGTVYLASDIDLGEETLAVPAGKTVVLNLNGHTVSGVENSTSSAYLLKNSGNLTIQGTGKLQIAATVNRGWNAYSSVVSNNPGGNLTVEQGVVIEHLGGTDMAYGIDNLTNGKGTYAVTTLEGATVKSTYSAVRQFLNGVQATNELYVNAGSTLVSPNRAVFFQDPSKSANTGKLYIDAAASVTGKVHLSVTAGSTEWPVEVSVASAALINGSKVTYSNVPAGYAVVEENGVWSVVEASFVSTQQALKDAIAANEPTIYVSGQIDLTEEVLANFGGTIIGVDNTACLNTRTFTVLAADEAYHLSNKTVNFKDITIKVPTEDGDFLKTGFVADGTMNFDNCVFEGQVTLNGHATWTFNKCEFGGADSGAYASFVYGAKKTTFNDCSFSGVDRAAKIYGTGGTIEAEYNNCTFASTTPNKYAVNIDASYATTTVALNGCSQTGMPGLYLVAGTKATVLVDGVQQ